MFKKMNEIAVLTSDGQIVIEQGSISGQLGSIAEIVIDAHQVQMLRDWLQEAAAEVGAEAGR